MRAYKHVYTHIVHLWSVFTKLLANKPRAASCGLCTVTSLWVSTCTHALTQIINVFHDLLQFTFSQEKRLSGTPDQINLGTGCLGISSVFATYFINTSSDPGVTKHYTLAVFIPTSEPNKVAGFTFDGLNMASTDTETLTGLETLWKCVQSVPVVIFVCTLHRVLCANTVTRCGVCIVFACLATQKGRGQNGHLFQGRLGHNRRF